MVLGKDKQNWQAFNQTHLEKKAEGPNKYNQKWKRRNYNWYHRNTKEGKKWLWTTICQEIWKPGWNGQISRKKYNLPKLNKEEENLNISIIAGEIKEMHPNVHSSTIYSSQVLEAT